jgi:class 3 adenylate cyclase
VDSGKVKHGEPPEEVIVAFTEYWKIVDKAMSRRKGRLLNRFGDGAIYLFDDAELAVVAAKNTLEDLLKFNESGNDLKMDFKVRIGLNTGDVVHDPAVNTGDVFSRVLDIAGHLQKMANPMEIVISENTYKKIKAKNEFTSFGRSEKDGLDIFVLKADQPPTKEDVKT